MNQSITETVISRSQKLGFFMCVYVCLFLFLFCFLIKVKCVIKQHYTEVL